MPLLKKRLFGKNWNLACWVILSIFTFYVIFKQIWAWHHSRPSYLNAKRAGGGRICPPQHFLLYLSRLLFFRAETSIFFFFKPCAQFKTIFLKIGPGVMTRRCVIERWVQRKSDQKLIFNGNLHTNRVFCIFLFQDTLSLHYVLSHLFGLFGVRTCVSILWHTSLPKNATFDWKNSEKPWFWRFLVIFVFLTWRHLWRHCGAYKVCLYFFWYNGLGRVI